MDGAGGNHGTVRTGQWEGCVGRTALLLLHVFSSSAGPHAGGWGWGWGCCSSATQQPCADFSSASSFPLSSFPGWLLFLWVGRTNTAARPDSDQSEDSGPI